MNVGVKEQFFRAYNPLYWQDSAHKFAYAANILFKQYEKVWAVPTEENKRPLEPDYRFSSVIPVIVLYAYAVENLAKGLLIAKAPKGKSVLKDYGKLDQYFKKHKPGKYVKAAGISLETREKELLDLLGQAARSGKYPIPTDPAHMSDHQKACSLYREEVSAIRKLFNRLDNELRSVAPGNTDPTMESQLNQTV